MDCSVLNKAHRTTETGSVADRLTAGHGCGGCGTSVERHGMNRLILIKEENILLPCTDGTTPHG